MVLNRSGFHRVHDQRFVDHILRKRNSTAHPHAFAFGGRNLVADPFGCDVFMNSFPDPNFFFAII